MEIHSPNYQSVSPFFSRTRLPLKQTWCSTPACATTCSRTWAGWTIARLRSWRFRSIQIIQTEYLMKSHMQDRSKALDGESAVSSRNLIPKFMCPVLDRDFRRQLCWTSTERLCHAWLWRLVATYSKPIHSHPSTAQWWIWVRSADQSLRHGQDWWEDEGVNQLW